MGQDDNYDKLVQAVQHKAAQDREVILAEAQAQVQQIKDQARAEIEQIQNEIQAEADRETALEKDRLLGQAHMTSRLAHQCARTRLLKQAFAEAKEAMAALPASPRYREILGALITEALAIAGPDALIKVAGSEEALCRKWLSQQGVNCTLEAIKAEPGTVLAYASDGDRHVDNGLATRLARTESLCLQDVAAILFQEDSDRRGAV